MSFVSRADNGFQELNVDDILAVANVPRSTFYYYFEHKSALLRTLAADVLEDLINPANAWWALPPNASKRDVAGAVRDTLAHYRRHAALLQAVADASTSDPEIRAHYNDLIHHAHEAAATHIRTGQQDGSVSTDADPDSTAAWLIWMAERGFPRLTLDAADDAIERHAYALTEILWKALYEGSPTRRS